MKKIILYTAVSMDGFIARKNGDIDWLNDSIADAGNEDLGFHEFYDGIDTTVMGAGTYRKILSFNIPFPYSGLSNWVITRNSEYKDDKDVAFIRKDICSFADELRRGDGKNIWLVGGGEANGLFIRNNLVDQVFLSIMPVVLGSGIPLFSGIISDHRFRLKSSKSFRSGVIQAIYERY